MCNFYTHACDITHNKGVVFFIYTSCILMYLQCYVILKLCEIVLLAWLAFELKDSTSIFYRYHSITWVQQTQPSECREIFHYATFTWNKISSVIVQIHTNLTPCERFSGLEKWTWTRSQGVGTLTGVSVLWVPILYGCVLGYYRKGCISYNTSDIFLHTEKKVNFLIYLSLLPKC